MKELTDREKLIEKRIFCCEKYNNWIHSEHGITIDLKKIDAFFPYNPEVEGILAVNLNGQIMLLQETEELKTKLKDLFLFKSKGLNI